MVDSLNVRISINISGIVFDAASMPNPAAFDTESVPSIGILQFLHANQIEKPECWCDEKSKSAKSSLRPLQYQRIDQHKRNAARMRFGAELWACLSFQE